MYIIATTAQSRIKDYGYIDEFLKDSGFVFIERKKRSVDELIQIHHADAVVVCYSNGPVLYTGKDKFFFHPSMAKNRLAAYRQKAIPDPLVESCQIKPNEEFLDCTLGLGADAIVASYFTPEGKVIGLESSPAIAPIVKWGMKLYNSQMGWLNEAIKRIKVINSDHYDFLRNTPDNSFDTIYFDPMFRQPILKSQAISPLRTLANPQALSKAAVEEACRVARKRVVIKELVAGNEFKRLGFKPIISSKHRKIAFGIIEV
jgi:16S rRNA (guanine1516-N2)-methyltransferase